MDVNSDGWMIEVPSSHGTGEKEKKNFQENPTTPHIPLIHDAGDASNPLTRRRAGKM